MRRWLMLGFQLQQRHASPYAPIPEEPRRRCLLQQAELPEGQGGVPVPTESAGRYGGSEAAPGPRPPPPRAPPRLSGGRSGRESGHRHPHVTSSQHPNSGEAAGGAGRGGDARCRPDPAAPRLRSPFQTEPPFPRPRGCKDQETRPGARPQLPGSGGTQRPRRAAHLGPDRGSPPRAGPEERPAPGTAPPRKGAAAAGGLLLPCPAASPPRPACWESYLRRPPTILPPLPRGCEPGRGQPAEPLLPKRAPDRHRQRLPPRGGAPPDPRHPPPGAGARPQRPSPLLRQAAGGISPTSDAPPKCCPRRGEGGREGGRGATPVTDPEAGRVAGPAACLPGGPGNKFLRSGHGGQCGLATTLLFAFTPEIDFPPHPPPRSGAAPG
ncbi:basic salivary proline-rich protein 3-like [Chroicocephalus ridibundus]|uniref:basic salivary proline-rich protein 3-like n=1 Tax=Chroicocephalus ridibundus TaxID=1192867 RepID=UPI002FDDA0DC